MPRNVRNVPPPHMPHQVEEGAAMFGVRNEVVALYNERWIHITLAGTGVRGLLDALCAQRFLVKNMEFNVVYVNFLI